MRGKTTPIIKVAKWSIMSLRQAVSTQEGIYAINSCSVLRKCREHYQINLSATRVICLNAARNTEVY